MNAHITLQQLGGNKFLAMTGSKVHSRLEGLTLRLSKNQSKANVLMITLDASDTYTMRFMRQGSIKEGFAVTDIEVIDGVYFDMLQDIFTRVTGLDTHL